MEKSAGQNKEGYTDDNYIYPKLKLGKEGSITVTIDRPLRSFVTRSAINTPAPTLSGIFFSKIYLLF